MDRRTFHARITWYHYVFLILAGVLAFYLLWTKAIIPAAGCMILLVFLIEKIIHTTYTVTTDGNLVISTGRFSKTKIIPLKDIIEVEKGRSAKFGGVSLTNFILIRYAKEKYVSVLPAKEREFMDLLEKK